MTSQKPRRILAGPALRAQPDRRLVTLARAGNEAALEEIIRRYRPLLVRYAASIVPSDRADDVAQDSLARALPGIKSGNGELNLRPWLYTIVRNAALNDLRDAGPPLQQLDENYDGVEQPPQSLERSEQLRSLLEGLGALPKAQREALVRREMEGLSHAAIGAELGVSTGAARQLIHRARTALRDGIGSLVPMPVIRQLLDGEGGGAAAAAGGSGAAAVKATAAVLATGAVVTAGIVLRDAHSHPQRDAIVALRNHNKSQTPEPPPADPRQDHPRSGKEANLVVRPRSRQGIAAVRGTEKRVGGAGTLAAPRGPLPDVKGSHPSGPGRGLIGGTQADQGHPESTGVARGPSSSATEVGGSDSEVPLPQPSGGSNEPSARGEADGGGESDSSSDDGRDTPTRESSGGGDSSSSQDLSSSGAQPTPNTGGSLTGKSSQD
jgi:RNA polymerase sigma factor (sigma-70 family)